MLIFYVIFLSTRSQNKNFTLQRVWDESVESEGRNYLTFITP